MEPDKDGIKVQEILRKFEANKLPPFRPLSIKLSPSAASPSPKKVHIVARRSPATSPTAHIPHLNPILELHHHHHLHQEVERSSTDKVVGGRPPITVSGRKMDGKRSVSEIAQMFQRTAGGSLEATTTTDVIGCLSKEVDPIKIITSENPAQEKVIMPTTAGGAGAPRKPVRTFAHDVYMCSKLVLLTTDNVREQPVTRAVSDKSSSSAEKPRLPPKPVARSKTVPIMPRHEQAPFRAKVAVRRPSAPPPPRPAITRTKSSVDKKTIVIPLKRSFSDEHIYDLPAVGGGDGQAPNKNDADATASDDEFVVVDNVVYGSNYAPYVVPYRESFSIPSPAAKELHYMSTPVVTFSADHEDARRCRSRSVSGRKLQRESGGGVAYRTLGRNRRAVTDEDLVNWSFSSVYATTPRRRSHATSANNSGKDNDSGDSDPEISEKHVRERIAYIHRISRGPSLKSDYKMNSCSYRNQYDAVLTVGLQFSEDGSSLQPFVKDVFPRLDSVKVAMETVARFCFPDAESWRPSSTGETHTFVLTNELGERLFGYCRKVKPEGASSSLPIAYCVLSPILARAYYFQVLVEIEKRHGLSDVQMKAFLQALYNRSVPHPGRTISLRCSNIDGDVRVAISRYNDFGLDNGDAFRLLTRLSISNLLKVYSCLLLERRVLMCSSSLNTLTESVMALVALLYPFSWQHTLVPVLPIAMLDVVASPTPYVIGVMSSAQPQLDEVPIEEGIVVDLDESLVISEAGDEETILPKKIQKGITASLKFVKHRSEVPGSPSSSLISEAFLTMFAKLVGHYRDHVECLPDGQKLFKRDSFCAAPTSRSERLFLEWFTETQMFQIFIENKMAENLSAQQDVFEKHIEKQRAAEPDFFKPTIRTNVFGFGKKVINFGEKLIGMK